MSYFAFHGPLGSPEKGTSASTFMPAAGVVNVQYEGDLMSVQLEPSATVGSLKGRLYEQTFLPPSAQGLFACVGSSPFEVSDLEALEMVPTSRPLALVMAGERPRC